MKDDKDRKTQELELEAKKKVGRPVKSPTGKIMSANDRAIARRAKIVEQIKHQAPESWKLQVCKEVLFNETYSDYQALALKRYAVIKEIKLQ
jgi:hypothetical protein